jgi:hypothetical protein
MQAHALIDAADTVATVAAAACCLLQQDHVYDGSKKLWWSRKGDRWFAGCKEAYALSVALSAVVAPAFLERSVHVDPDRAAVLSSIATNLKNTDYKKLVVADVTPLLRRDGFEPPQRSRATDPPAAVVSA